MTLTLSHSNTTFALANYGTERKDDVIYRPLALFNHGEYVGTVVEFRPLHQPNLPQVEYRLVAEVFKNGVFHDAIALFAKFDDYQGICEEIIKEISI